jgi:hypothetical protein
MGYNEFKKIFNEYQFNLKIHKNKRGLAPPLLFNIAMYYFILFTTALNASG